MRPPPMFTWWTLSPSSAKEQLCMNITSSLVQILKVTQESWTQDLQQRSKNGSTLTTSSSSTTMLTQHRRTGSGRVVFVEPGSSTHHRRTLSGRVVYEEESGVSSTHHDYTHDRRTSSGKVVLEDSVSEESVAMSKVKQGLALLHSVRFVNETRQRVKFVPFLLRNSTGLPLKFATLTSAPSKVCVRKGRERERERERELLLGVLYSGLRKCFCSLREDKAGW